MSDFDKWNDDDEDDFFDGYEEPDEESLEEVRKEDERIHNMPVYKKAMEIAEITHTITEMIEPEKDVLEMRSQMLGNAYTLAAKIAGAEGGDLYSIRFDNATLIKLAARELRAQTSLLKHEKICDEKYIKLLRDEIGKFRILFLDWVRSFDKTNDIEDEWDFKNL